MIIGTSILSMSKSRLTIQYEQRFMPDIIYICFKFFSRSCITAPTIKPGRRLSPTEMTKSSEITLVSFS